MAKATELIYTDKEMAAIEAVKNVIEPATLAELGVSSGTIVSIQKKAAKVAAGELSVPEGTVVANLEVGEKEVEYTATKVLKTYKLA